MIVVSETDRHGIAMHARRSVMGATARATAYGCFALIGVAALSKFADLRWFAASLAGWSVIPDALAVPLAVSLPLLEVMLVLAWITLPGNPRVTAATLAVLIGFTVGLAAELLLGTAPDCGCFGVLLAWTKGRQSIEGAIVRNVALGGVLAASRRLGWRRAAIPLPALPPPSPQMRTGTTLIELLAALAAVATLLAFLLPTLAGVRARVQAIGAMSDLRQHVGVFSSYSIDHDDQFPYYTDPNATYSVLRHPPIAVAVSYWVGYFYWNVALADHYDGGPWQSCFNPPALRARRTDHGESLVGTNYYYGHGFISRPDYWRRETRLADRSQWRPTRQSEVQYPSLKGLLRDEWSYSGTDLWRPPRLTGPVNVGFCDGSAREIARFDLVDSYPGGPGMQHLDGVPTGVAVGPVMATIGGVDGRDVR